MTGLADVRRGLQMAQAGVGIFLAPNRTGQFIVTRVTPGGPAQRYAGVGVWVWLWVRKFLGWRCLLIQHASLGA